MEDRWTIELFGQLCARQGGRAVSRFRTQKAAALLAYLALHPHRLHPREELADLLWPDSAFDSGRVNLRQALAFLRRALEPPGGSRLFQTQGYSHIGLIPGAFQTDVAVFEDALRRAARAASDTERAEWLNRAVQAYGGPLLPGFYEEWILGERERLAEQYADAERRLSPLQHLLPVSALPPPAPILDAKPDLPRQMTPFFGRADELAALLTMLHAPHAAVLTVIGPGGTGKTRFALEAAARLADSRFERVVFVPLADLAEASLILPAILDALDIPPDRHLPPAAQIAQTLAGTPTLLLLDNFEHLVEAGAPLLADLLRRAPHLSVLVTSRRPLGIEGEREFALPPLQTPDKPELPARLLEFPSVQLFIDRAQAIRPDFQVTTRNARTVGALCARLEGLPLALELAAAWAQTMTASEMLARHRFDLLQSRRRDIAPRHQTMRAALDGSFRLLPADLASIWLRLSVFRGGWTVDAARSLCPEADVVAAMAALRERSLIQTETAGEPQDDRMRFRMLETLREFAQEQLSEDEAQDAARRHAFYFTHLAEQAEPEWSGPNLAVCRERMDAEADNMRAALAWALSAGGDAEMGLRLAAALMEFWGARGLYAEGCRWLDALRTACPDAPVLLRARAAYVFARLTVEDMAAKRTRIRESLILFRQAGDAVGMVRALTQKADALLQQSQPDAARACLDEAPGMCRTGGDRAGQARILHLQGELHIQQGKLTEALTLMRRSLALYRALGDEMNVVAMLCHLGCWLCWSGQLEFAAPLLEEAVAFSRQHGNKPNLAHALWGLGAVAKVRGDLDDAAALFGESLRLYQEMGQTGCPARWELADTLCRRGDWAQAKPLLLENLRRSESRDMERWYLSRLARAACAEGQWERAARLAGVVWSFPGQSPRLPPEIVAPDDDPLLQSLLQDLSAHLRPDRLRAAWNAGRALGLDEALTEVLE